MYIHIAQLIIFDWIPKIKYKIMSITSQTFYVRLKINKKFYRACKWISFVKPTYN